MFASLDDGSAQAVGEVVANPVTTRTMPIRPGSSGAKGAGERLMAANWNALLDLGGGIPAQSVTVRSRTVSGGIWSAKHRACVRRSPSAIPSKLLARSTTDCMLGIVIELLT